MMITRVVVVVVVTLKIKKKFECLSIDREERTGSVIAVDVEADMERYPGVRKR